MPCPTCGRRPPTAVAILALVAATARPAAGEPPVAAGPPNARAVAAARAAERGWWEAARRAWRTEAAPDGERTSGSSAPESTAAVAATRLAALNAIESAIARGVEARAAAAAHAWNAERSPAWRTMPVPRPAAAGITVAGGLVLWNSGRALHGIRVADGRPPWPADAADRDTTIFPRGLAAAGRDPRSAVPRPGQPCVIGDRGYAVLALSDGSERLVCVDLSSGAEGRLVWAVDAAALTAAVALAERRAGRSLTAGMSGGAGVAFDGQPTADHELCLVVMRAAPDRGGRLLAAFAAADGRLAWIRPAGSARTPGGDDLAAGCRRPSLAEDRIILVSHAGTIHGFDRDGAAAWTTATSLAAAAGPAGNAAAPAPSPGRAIDAVFAGGRVVVAPRDRAGVLAIDPWSGAIVWEWSRADERVEHLLGGWSDGVVVATSAADKPARLRRLAIADGRETAVRPATPADGPTRIPVGEGLLVGATVLWPLGGAGASVASPAGTVLEVLDAATLERRRKPLELPAAPGARVVVAADTAGLAGATVACIAGTSLIRLAP